MLNSHNPITTTIRRVLVFGTLFLLLLSGCINPASTVTPISTSSIQVSTVTTSPTHTPALIQTVTVVPTPTQEIATGVCSPLIGIDRENLYRITANKYDSPAPYVESGHPAIDLSFYRFESFTTFKNFPLQAVLPGTVVLIENNRFPYGYMLLVETPLSQVDPSFLPSIPQPTPLPESVYSMDDRCPVTGSPVTWDDSGKSIYVLYAHLSQLPEFKVGDEASCGQPIGFAGTTGNSVEDHLHLEMRIGPSKAQFGSIATQHSSTTLEERYNYCIWSLSGVFQPFDPAILLFP
jgi:murein DD-endopeptidase MepM/ murein hydrolase activator NlpD